MEAFDIWVFSNMFSNNVKKLLEQEICGSSCFSNNVDNMSTD